MAELEARGAAASGHHQPGTAFRAWQVTKPSVKCVSGLFQSLTPGAYSLGPFMVMGAYREARIFAHGRVHRNICSILLSKQYCAYTLTALAARLYIRSYLST